jgi:hypothetical protein
MDKEKFCSFLKYIIVSGNAKEKNVIKTKDITLRSREFNSRDEIKKETGAREMSLTPIYCFLSNIIIHFVSKQPLNSD